MLVQVPAVPLLIQLLSNATGNTVEDSSRDETITVHAVSFLDKMRVEYLSILEVKSFNVK